MALISDITKYRRPRYVESKPPDERLVVGTLLTPTITFNKNLGIIGWGNIDPSAQYIVFYKSTDSITYTEFAKQSVSSGNTRDLKGDQDANVFSFNTAYTIKIRTIAIKNGQEYSSALSSATESFTITKLATPTLSVLNAGKSQYYWNTIQNANKYRLYGTLNTQGNAVVTKTIEAANIYTQANPLNLEYTRVDTYSIYVDAINDESPFLFRNSDPSNVEIYNVNKLASPIVTSFSVDENYLEWDSVTNANSYIVYLNGEAVDTTSSTNYDYTLDVSTLRAQDILDYEAYVVATKTSQGNYPNPKYIDSEKSVSTFWGTLRNPVISISNNIVTIDNFEDITNVEYFEIWDFGMNSNPTAPIARIDGDTSSYPLVSSEPRYFSIKVKACSDAPDMADSALSNEVTFIVSRLNSPIVSATTVDRISTIRWQYIQNADYYEIYSGEKLIRTVSSTGSQNYSVTLTLSTGYHGIKVYAKSNNAVKYLPSYPSNLVSINQLPTQEYQVTINNTKYDMILPFEITKTLDETMDIASLTLASNDIKDPFEAYTEVVIEAGDYESDSEAFTNKPGFPIYMIISEDDVEEVPIGGISKYKHHLTLIERTKLLECELLPDFSVTQSMEYSQRVNEKGDPATVEPDLITTVNGNEMKCSIWGSEPTKLVKFTQWSQRALPVGTKNKYSSGLKDQSLDNMYRAYSKSEIFNKNNNYNLKLPRENANSFDIESKYIYYGGETGPSTGSAINIRFTDIKETNVYNSLTDWGIELNRTYKYRVHNDTTENTILSTTNNDYQYWDITNLDEGYYDIILEISVDSSRIKDYLRDEYWSVTSQDIIDKIEFMYYGNITSDSTSNLSSSRHGNIDSTFESNLIRYRAVWNNIEIRTGGSVGITVEYGAKTLLDTVEKMLKILTPIGVDSESKYKLDPNVRNILANLATPELKFQGQKSLYEALSIIGKQFYGIPRLGCYIAGQWDPNCITFDILDPNILDAINIENEREFPEVTKSSLENHNTGFISDLSNIIDLDSYSIYPPGDIWTTPRSGSEDDPLANKDNMAVVLDKPIYKLVDILVKNYDENNPDNIISIKPYCLEKTMFDSLANTSQQKGTSIYYEQGNNKIEGLGRIPEASELDATLGLSATDYIISKIISSITGISTSTLNDNVDSFEYKIVYIPYTDARIITEQSNLAGLKNYNYKNLNQDDNIISANAFGKSAQNQVSRLGNNSIEKTYILEGDSMFNLPQLGNIKEYDGYNYYADIIRYIYNNKYSSATVSFSKNFNKINDRIGIDAAYRLYRIYANEQVSRSVNTNGYCYLTLGTPYHGPGSVYNGLLSKFQTSIYNAYYNNGNEHQMTIRPDSLYIEPIKLDSSPLRYNDFAGYEYDVPAAILPVSMYTFGNSLAFVSEFKDNFSAGVKIDRLYTDNKQGIQKDVRYVNNEGECPAMEFTLFSMDSESKDKLGLTPGTWPEASRQINSNTLNEALYSKKIYLDKDNREKIKFVYQIHMITFDKNLTIHPGALKNIYKDPLFSNEETEMETQIHAYLVTGDISKRIKLPSGPRQEIQFTMTNSNLGYVSLDGALVTPDRNDYTTVAYAWDDGTIAFSFKDNITGGQSYLVPSLYLNMSDEKIENPN